MATANFTFTTLTGSETAGWQSINALITSIDTQLYSKASGIAAGGTVVGQLLRWNGTSWVAGTVSASSIDNNAVELGTKTTGNYVATLAGQAGETDVSGSGAESAAVSVRLANNTALRGAATVESAPDFDPGYTADNKVVDTDFVLDALSYATTGGVTLSGDVTGATNANTISNGAVTYTKLNDNVKYLTPISVTTSGASARTFSISDSENKMIEYNSASAGTFTVPADATTNFPIGSQINILQVNTGQLTIAGATTPTTVTVNSTPGLKLRAQWSSATLIKRAANTWVLIGDVTI